jgi:hypothetical protein
MGLTSTTVAGLILFQSTLSNNASRPKPGDSATQRMASPKRAIRQPFSLRPPSSSAAKKSHAVAVGGISGNRAGRAAVCVASSGSGAPGHRRNASGRRGVAAAISSRLCPIQARISGRLAASAEAAVCATRPEPGDVSAKTRRVMAWRSRRSATAAPSPVFTSISAKVADPSSGTAFHTSNWFRVLSTPGSTSRWSVCQYHSGLGLQVKEEEGAVVPGSCGP